jgi:DNA-binding MarR family transcriptional regulator
MDSHQLDPNSTKVTHHTVDPNADMEVNPFDTSGQTTAEHILIGLSKIGIALKSQSWQDAGQQGLTPTQGQILALLLDKSLRLSDIANYLSISAATASDAVTTLVDKGLVQKVKSPNDGRAIDITLTATGVEAAKTTSGWADFLLSTVDELSEEERTVFLRALIKMIRNLQENGKISVANMCVTCTFFQPYRYDDAEYPHHCGLVNAPFGDRHLRINCPEQIPADAKTEKHNWQFYLEGTTK